MTDLTFDVSFSNLLSLIKRIRVKRSMDHEELFESLVETIHKVFVKPKLLDKNNVPVISLTYKLESRLHAEEEIELECGADLELLCEEKEKVRIIVYVEGILI